jgi:hypothetical protein
MLLGFVLGATVIGLAVARSSAQEAILDSVRADLGQKSYALQTGSPAAVEALRAMKGVSPVQDQTGDVLADGLSAPVLVRTTTSSSLDLGIVTRGTQPGRVGDVLLSEVTAESLGIELGDTVQVRTGGVETPGRVVGLSVDPANRATSTLVQLVADSATFQPTMWLSDVDFYDDSALQSILDRRTATYRSVGTLLAAAAENRPRFLSAMRFVPAGCGLLVGVLLASVGTVLARRWRTDVDTLVAAGMAPAIAWRRIVSIAFGTVVLGEVLGGGAATAVLSLSRGPVSGWVGQYWARIAVPWQEPLSMLGLTVLSALLAMPVVRLVLSRAARGVPSLRQRRWTAAVATSVAGVGLAGWVVLLRVSLQPEGDWAAAFTPLAAAIIAAAAPFVIAPAVCWGLPTATRSLLRYLVAGLRPVAAVGAIVAVLSSVWAAQTTHEANVGEAASSPLEPAGSFVISEMPDTAIPALTELYRSHGGEEVVRFGIPDESTTQLRVTGTKVVSCMSERGVKIPTVVAECFPQKATSPINRVLMGPPGSTARADPNLVEVGKVGLLQFAGSDGTASRLADTHAEADPMLGGNLPGLVIPSDGNAAKEFGLAPAGTSEVVLLDFSRMTPHDQFLIRAAAIRLAPSAETANGSDPTAYDRLRSTANTVSFLGATAAMVIVLLGGVSMVVAHSLTRRTLVDIGAATSRRWGIVTRWTAVPVVAGALTIPLAILTASSGGQITDTSYGALWILPGVLAMVASLVVAVAFLRPPQQTGE